MNILINGIKSFTGLSLINRLIEDQNNLICVTSSKLKISKNLNKEQLTLFEKVEANSKCDILEIDYGDPKTQLFNQSNKLDNIGCIVLHGFDTSNYRSNTYSPITSAKESLKWIISIKDLIGTKKNIPMFLTGTYFQNAIKECYTNYAFAKKLSWEILKLNFPKFNHINYLFPNPFGFGESEKLSFRVLESWGNRKAFEISQPYQLRDNIPVDFLIDDYVNTIYKISKINQFNPPVFLSPSYFRITNLEFLLLIKENLQNYFSDFKCEININKNNLEFNSILGNNSIRHKYLSKEIDFWANYIKNRFLEF